MQLLRYILLPVVPIYFVVTWFRNKLYDFGWLESKTYSVPTICVGNLSTGGTGKTPMVEYLIRLLKEERRVATLSRGYKRKSSGYVLADNKTTVEEIGDEPFQFKSKFPSIDVAVDADRQNGISKLLDLKEPPEVILLDDAFQHRKVNAGLNILLSSYDQLYIDDILLPTGNLRESKTGARRADLIVITKSPSNLSEIERNRIGKKLKLKARQKLFFSSIKYSDTVFGKEGRMLLNDIHNKSVTLVTGIANPKPLLNHLMKINVSVEHLEYSDHHNFTLDELTNLEKKEFILTTEKDYVKLKSKLRNTNLYYLPISFDIEPKDQFDSEILEFVNSTE